MSTNADTLWLSHESGSHFGTVIDRLKELPKSGMVELQVKLQVEQQVEQQIAEYTVQVYNLGNAPAHIDDGKVIGIIARDPSNPLAPCTLVELTYDESDRWSCRLLKR